MAEIKSYKELKIRQQGMQLVKEIYALTHDFPRSEIYGLTAQIRRATVSIPANIAEGQARKGTKEFIQFLSIARASVAEIETLVIASEDLSYLSRDKSKQTQETCLSITKQINALIKALKNRSDDS